MTPSHDRGQTRAAQMRRCFAVAFLVLSGCAAAPPPPAAPPPRADYPAPVLPQAATETRYTRELRSRLEGAPPPPTREEQRRGEQSDVEHTVEELY